MFKPNFIVESVDSWSSKRVAHLVICLTLCGVVGLTSASSPVFGQQPGKGNQPTSGKPADGKDKKGDGEKKDEKKKKEDAPKPLTRPTKPEEPADPKELEVRPDENGLLQFGFQGQPWPAVLKWLADNAGYSLDWLQMPPDYVNLKTPRALTIPETRDLINGMLLGRGYTMVLRGKVLSVFKIDQLDPSLLPRVEDESQLLDLAGYDFVKITFSLPDELKADKAAEDIKPLLSPHAKVQPLLATNRLLVIDAVANLREASRLINSEHAAATGHQVPHEFVVYHARADYVADQVMILLGLDPASRRTPQELQIEQQRLQLFTQMQQKGKDVTKYLRKDGPSVYLAVNHRRNSILVNAPPAEMRIIQRSIEKLDSARGAMASAGPGTGPPRGGQPYMKKYPLVTISPQSIVSTLEEIGDLDPQSRLKIDSDANLVMAFATAADHEKINAMVDSLDGTGREFEVIWLRRLRALAVAETVKALMVGEEEKKNSNRNRYYGYYSYYGYGRQEKKNPNEGFRVQADVEQNRLLLWATEAEREQVRELLAQLGEIPGHSSNPNTVRVLAPRGDEATLRILDHIRRAWPAIGANELRIEGTPDAPADDKKEQESDQPLPTEASVDPVDSDIRDTSTARMPAARPRLPAGRTHFVQLGAAPGKQAVDDRPSAAGRSAVQKPGEGSSGLPPVTITISQDGRIIISSRDTSALDRLESLLAEIAPPPKDYEVFYLKHAFASIVTLNLEEYFEEEGEFDTEDNWMRAYWGYDFKATETSGVGLAQQRKIRFIYDPDTNSILVSNASPSQLETVKELIDIYDRAPPEDSISARQFKVFELKYSKATQVAKTIKEVYRDLLSSKDKEFAKGNDQKQSSQSTTNYVRLYGGSGSDDQKKPTKVKASFAGALSVGIDELTNTIIISAQEEWMPSIEQMIRYLDTHAESTRTTVAMERSSAPIQSQAMRALLTGMFAEQGAKVAGAAAQQPEEPQAENQQQPNQDGKENGG